MYLSAKGRKGRSYRKGPAGVDSSLDESYHKKFRWNSLDESYRK